MGKMDSEHDIYWIADILSKNAPAHFRDIIKALSELTKELDYAKVTLSNDLISAQNNDDFSKAHEIIDAQKELRDIITTIENLLGKYENIESDEEELVEVGFDEEEDSDDRESIDYTQYSTDDSVAYDITNTPVVFKRPAGFSLRNKRYTASSWQAVLIGLCEALYYENPTIIKNIADSKRQPGKHYVKISRNKNNLRRPKEIKNSGVWIETNRSASDIRIYILALLERYNIPTDELKVFFRRDYTALHDNRTTTKIFFEPVNVNQWNIFEKVRGENYIEPFLATKSMSVGDVVLFHVGSQNSDYESGIYAYGTIVKGPYIVRNRPSDYCNNKNSVDIRIDKVVRGNPLISHEESKAYIQQFRTVHCIDERHYDKLRSILGI